ncbi:UNVERIFIED_CONTAM: hypothetical protein Slati_0447200 [Sesamum latifolium]|uniref:Reverse transcriptase domain-containing protein n=1 Tax=Sesamum latifolium TaxID=2727402 RepID=A0AAW2XW47_9LAMI
MNSENRGDNDTYEGNSSLPIAAGPVVPPADPAVVATNTPNPDPTSKTNTTAPALDKIVGPAAMSPLFCEQFRETINLTLLGSQASGTGPSSHLKEVKHE